MSWREFAASIVHSLAWPGAMVILAAVLRRQIAGLLRGEISRLKIGPGGFELEWDRTADKAAVSSARALPSPQEPDIEEELESVATLIDTVPTVAVTGCFAIVERELLRVVDEHAIELPTHGRGSAPASLLVKAAWMGGAITKDTGDAIRGLIELRNLAAHSPSGTDVTPEQARDFFAIARAVLFALANGPLPPKP